MRTTVIVPTVTVPVLSRTSVPADASRSRTSPPRTRIPARAALPSDATIVKGVAKPNAHGHVTTSMAITMPGTRAGSMRHQTTPTIAVNTSTTMRNQPAIRFANSTTGGRFPAASSTIREIAAARVASPDAVTHSSIGAAIARVPANTAPPHDTCTGRASPVNSCRSRCASPPCNDPSAGIWSPAATRTMSPIRSASAGISESAPSASTRNAVCGTRAHSNSIS